MLGNEGLEFVLLREALSFERLKPSLLIPGVDSLGHVCDPSCHPWGAFSVADHNPAGHTRRTLRDAPAA